MPVKVHVIFYSMYGHIYRMAEAVAEGAREVQGAEVSLFQAAELVPDAALERTGAKQARAAFAHVPVADPKRLDEADCIFFGTPTRYGNVCAQVQNLMDQTGALWVKGSLIGKVASVFVSTATQHGGQETTLFSGITNLMHFGMIIVGLPYSFQGQMTLDEIVGGSPYGATTIAGGQGQRQPSEIEKSAARFQGRLVAETAAKLSR